MSVNHPHNSTSKTILVDQSLFQPSSRSKKSTNSHRQTAKQHVNFRNPANTIHHSGRSTSTPEQKQRERLIKFLIKRQEQNFRKSHSQKPNLLTLPLQPTQTQIQESIPQNVSPTSSELDQSIDYLLALSEQAQDQELRQAQSQSQNQNQTLKQYPNANSNASIQIQGLDADPLVSMEFPSELDPKFGGTSSSPSSQICLNNPRFGCLKNGDLPTYRQYKHHLTQKLHPDFPSPSSTPIPIQNPNTLFSPSPPNLVSFSPSPSPSTPNSVYSPSPPETLSFQDSVFEDTTPNSVYSSSPSSSFSIVNPNPSPNPSTPTPIPTQQRRIARRTFRIGKHRNRPEVTVLLSNRTLRRNVNNTKQEIDQTPIQDIKKFLIKRGLIKVGTTAPESILRTLYRNTRLTHGEVNNVNPDYLLHNFFTTNPNPSSGP